jgi:hypothetical protein
VVRVVAGETSLSSEGQKLCRPVARMWNQVYDRPTPSKLVAVKGHAIMRKHRGPKRRAYPQSTQLEALSLSLFTLKQLLYSISSFFLRNTTSLSLPSLEAEVFVN